MWNRKQLGQGIGLRHTHFAHLLEHGPGPDVAWFEAISENFFEPGGRPWAVLEKVRSEVPVAIHGVSMAVGNAGPLSEAYLAKLETLIERIEPAWVSDHLCWGGLGRHYAHDLWPLPYTGETLAHVSGKIARVQDRLGRQVLIENVSSYVGYAESEMPEWEFLTEIARRADCGILLDVNNIFVSAKNHGFDPNTYLNAIPSELVGQIHAAGHTDKGGWILDSHIGPVPDAVWTLYQRALERLGPVPTLVEWDEEIPEYETVVAESRRAGQIAREALHAA